MSSTGASARAGSPTPRDPDPRADRRIAARLAVCAFLLYAFFAHGHFSGSDELGVFQTTEALYERGDLAIARLGHAYRGADGRFYSIFAVGQAVLALPFYAAGAWLGGPEGGALVGREFNGRTIDTFETPATWAVSFYAPLASAVLLAVFFLFQRSLGVARRPALGCAVLLGATTYVATQSVYFLRHTTEALTILGCLLALHAWRRSGRLRWLLTASLVGSLTLLIRVPAVAAAPGLAGYALATLAGRRRESGPDGPRPGEMAAALLLPALGVLLIHVGVNEIKWGNPIASPMLRQTAMFDAPLTGLRGLLLSPGSSLFAYSPLLLLLPFTLPPFWRRWRAECVALVAIALSFLALSAGFAYWHGLWSAPGPRMVFVATVLLMVPLGPWLDRPLSRARRGAVAALAAGGATIQLALVSTPWQSVMVEMGYREDAPPFAFLFSLERGPIVGSWRALVDGRIDTWLWSLWQGAPGRGPVPEAAVALAVLWALGLAGALAALIRAVRRG